MGGGGVKGMTVKRGNDERKGYDGGRGVKYERGKTEYGGQGSFMRGDGIDGNHERWTRENQKKLAKGRRKGARRRKRYD